MLEPGQHTIKPNGELVMGVPHWKVARELDSTFSDEVDYEEVLYKLGCVRVRTQSDGHLVIAGEIGKVKRYYRKVMSPKVKYVSAELITPKRVFKNWITVEEFEELMTKF